MLVQVSSSVSSPVQVSIMWSPVALWKRHRQQKWCFHGLPFSSLDETGQCFITGHIIDLGRRKLWECKEERGGCGKIWII